MDLIPILSKEKDSSLPEMQEVLMKYWKKPNKQKKWVIGGDILHINWKYLS